MNDDDKNEQDQVVAEWLNVAANQDSGYSDK